MTVEENFVFAPDHPALAGHFPGDPIVPGSVLLDRAAAIARERGGWLVTGVRRARFKAPLRPGIDCVMRLSPRDDEALDLTCRVGQKIVLVAILDCTADDEKA
jgi:3-hydroxymyristoyl/3-hydroxydecanoyl-(acyl carrier protein) dehydratase